MSTLPLDSSPEQVQGLQLIQVARYYTTAVLAVAVWDWLVCFYAEYERIWRERWSLIKVLYLITRKFTYHPMYIHPMYTYTDTTRVNLRLRWINRSVFPPPPPFVFPFVLIIQRKFRVH